MWNLLKRALAYRRTYGTRALLRRVRRGVSDRIEEAAPQVAAIVADTVGTKEQVSARELLSQRFSALTPLASYRLPSGQGRRVTVVTDSISPGSLFGGVGTALILATLLANRMGCNLRLITRTEPARESALDDLLSVYGLELQAEAEFVFSPCHETQRLVDYSEGDLFITTSWWTTVSTLGSIPARNVWYLLQEDERMFYPFGDDRRRCEAVLQRSDIRTIVNTRLLFEHLQSHGLEHLKSRGIWFEPAFPLQVYAPRPKKPGAKRTLVFYARPNNLRNLFYLGIEVLDAALSQGVINPDQWDIVLMGKDIPSFVFSDGTIPQKRENMGWAEYAALAAEVDLGLCLMDTPHPSYPPLDLAASGAVVVTNQHGNKQSLRAYSSNVLCAAASCEALVDALKEGMKLAVDSERRERNYAGNGLERDWQRSLEPVLAAMTGAH